MKPYALSRNALQTYVDRQLKQIGQLNLPDQPECTGSPHWLLQATAHLLANLDHSLDTHLEQVGWRLLNLQSRDSLDWQPATRIGGVLLLSDARYPGHQWQRSWKAPHLPVELLDTSIDTLAGTSFLCLHLRLLGPLHPADTLRFALSGNSANDWQCWESLVRRDGLPLVTRDITGLQDPDIRPCGLGSLPNRLLWPRSLDTRWAWAYWQDVVAFAQAVRQFEVHPIGGSVDKNHTIRIPLHPATRIRDCPVIEVNPVTLCQISEGPLRPVCLQPGQQVYPLEWLSVRHQARRVLRAWESGRDPDGGHGNDGNDGNDRSARGTGKPSSKAPPWHIESLPDKGPAQRFIDWLIIDSPVKHTGILSLQALCTGHEGPGESALSQGFADPHPAHLARSMAKFLALRYTLDDMANLDTGGFKQALQAWIPPGSGLVQTMVDAIESVRCDSLVLLSLEQGLPRTWPGRRFQVQLRDPPSLPMGPAGWAHLLACLLAGLGNTQQASCVAITQRSSNPTHLYQTPWRTSPWQTLHPFSAA